MPATIQIDYEQMKSISSRFDRFASAVKGPVSDVQQQQEILKNGAWISDAANDFFNQMDTVVLPALNRLIQALEQTSVTANDVYVLMDQAETDAEACIPTDTV